MLNIALICGGDSSECEISINSSLNVLSNIDLGKFTPYLIFINQTHWYAVLNEDKKPIYDTTLSPQAIFESVKIAKGEPLNDKIETKYIVEEINKTNFSLGNVKFDKALIMVHGTPGENGLLQGYLEMMNIPFASCSSFVSAITFDKHSCKRFLDYAGIKMAKDVFIRKDSPYSTREIARQIGFPMFIKPTVGGSSYGVTKVKSEDKIEEALQHAFTECDMVIAEEAIEGREVTCGIYKVGEEVCKLPITEIVTEREFFDYEAKYLGESKEICPAPISKELTIKIQNTSERVYNYMGCSGLVRIDYIVDKDENIYFLEINTIPGMTKMSLVPKMLEVYGISVQDFLTNMLLNC